MVGSLTPGAVRWLKLNFCVKTETKHISFKKNKPPTNQKKPHHPKPHHLQTVLRVYSKLSWAAEFETTVFPSPSWWDNSCKKRNRNLAQQKLMINNGAKLWKHFYSPNDSILNIFKYELGTVVSCNSTVGRTSNFSTLEFQSSKQGKHCRAPVLHIESNEELWFQPDNRPNFDISQHSSQSINHSREQMFYKKSHQAEIPMTQSTHKINSSDLLHVLHGSVLGKHGKQASGKNV